MEGFRTSVVEEASPLHLHLEGFLGGGGFLEGGLGKALEEYSAEVVFLLFCKININ